MTEDKMARKHLGGRAFNDGWQLVCLHDAAKRRGIWYRQQDENVLELCAGREGDDVYCKLTVGGEITPRLLAELHDIFQYGAWILYVAAIDLGRFKLKSVVASVTSADWDESLTQCELIAALDKNQDQYWELVDERGNVIHSTDDRLIIHDDGRVRAANRGEEA